MMIIIYLPTSIGFSGNTKLGISEFDRLAIKYGRIVYWLQIAFAFAGDSLRTNQ